MGKYSQKFCPHKYTLFLIENHRTESQYERNRVSKILIFEFVNNFMSLFYIAFYLRDIPLLQWVNSYLNFSSLSLHYSFSSSFEFLLINYFCLFFSVQQVALMLLVFQVINQFTETLWPYLNRRYVLNKVRLSTGICLFFSCLIMFSI